MRAGQHGARPGGVSMRARYPDRDGYVERDGVKIFYEVFGDGEPTILLLPTWSIVHSRHWKMQVPYLARHYRVVTFDGRGNGRSDRPTGPDAYAEREFVADAVAVMDATETERAVVAGLSMGSQRALLLAAEHPDRVSGAVFIGPALPTADLPGERAVVSLFDEDLGVDESWARYNRYSWLRDYRGFLEFFFGEMFTEPHSTKQTEDAVGWGLETTAETLIDTRHADAIADTATCRALCERVTCPTLVIVGSEDAIQGVERGVRLAEFLGPRSRLVVMEGSGHAPQARDPVEVNLLMREFIDSVHSPAPTPRQWARGRSRRKRAVYISSPIGLGHARRDVAIADELRKLHPDLEIDWLAQPPVTRVLEERGERLHPASAELSSEVDHIDSESAEHDLHCFSAWRRMDEILLSNFMVFHDLVQDGEYDLWIGDEAWE